MTGRAGGAKKAEFTGGTAAVRRRNALASTTPVAPSAAAVRNIALSHLLTGRMNAQIINKKAILISSSWQPADFNFVDFNFLQLWTKRRLGD
jgi:hypothetical protein